MFIDSERFLGARMGTLLPQVKEMPHMPLTDTAIKALRPKEKPYKAFDGGGH